MRRGPTILALWCAAVSAHAWHDPHVSITRAAIASLPPALRAALGGEAESISQVYSFYPDRYGNASAMERAAMRRYCETAAGRSIHNITWDRAEDRAALEHLFEGTIAGLRAGKISEAAQYVGVMAHLLEDSISPAHAMDMRLLQDLIPGPPRPLLTNLHAAIEMTAPEFDLAGHTPVMVGAATGEAAEEILVRCYAIVKDNRAHLLEMANAVYSDDRPVADRLRLRAAHAGGYLLADALYTVMRLAGGRWAAPEPESEQWKGVGVELAVSRSGSAHAARRAALHVALGLREAVRMLQVDQRVRRTSLSRVVVYAGATFAEIEGHWVAGVWREGVTTGVRRAGQPTARQRFLARLA